MSPERFTAKSAAEAVAQIRQKLGPNAVVINVRRQAPSGLAFWRKPWIEVVATVPEPEPVVTAPSSPEPALPSALEQRIMQPDIFEMTATTTDYKWRVGAVLESLGILPLYVSRVLAQLEKTVGTPPDSLVEQLNLVHAILSRQWRSASPLSAGQVHVFIGAPGVGKSTCLCKWLTRSVLLEGQSARVWRLDGKTANTAELLSVHSEILGVPVARSWNGEASGVDCAFVDFPGIPIQDKAAIKELSGWLASIPHAQVHLVLNTAYESSQLLGQVAAFSSLPISDLIITHLDEEPRHAKLWNLVFGTNYSLRFLSSGQNIPGDFRVATETDLWDYHFPSKPVVSAEENLTSTIGKTIA